MAPLDPNLSAIRLAHRSSRIRWAPSGATKTYAVISHEAVRSSANERRDDPDDDPQPVARCADLKDARHVPRDELRCELEDDLAVNHLAGPLEAQLLVNA